MEWQPIETAPEAGKRLLFFPAVPPKRQGGIGMDAMMKVDFGTGGQFRKATHWMPLPEPPQSSEDNHDQG